jgi:hypothetical protein
VRIHAAASMHVGHSIEMNELSDTVWLASHTAPRAQRNSIPTFLPLTGSVAEAECSHAPQSSIRKGPVWLRERSMTRFRVIARKSGAWVRLAEEEAHGRYHHHCHSRSS